MRVYFERDNPNLDNDGHITLIAVEPVDLDGTEMINYIRTYVECTPKAVRYEADDD